MLIYNTALCKFYEFIYLVSGYNIVYGFMPSTYSDYSMYQNTNTILVLVSILFDTYINSI